MAHFFTTIDRPRKDSLGKDIVYEIKIKFNPQTLNIASISSNVLPANRCWDTSLKKNEKGNLVVPRTLGVELSDKGAATVFWFPARYAYADKKDDESWSQYFRTHSPHAITDLMHKLYDLISKKN